MGEIKLHEAGENYLEALLELSVDGAPVRSVDVAQRLGVSKPSVNKAMGILKEAGMVEQQLYGNITLTQAGRARAEQVQARHAALKKFLHEVLGVPLEIADEDACKMEHVVSEVTMEQLIAFLDR